MQVDFKAQNWDPFVISNRRAGTRYQPIVSRVRGVARLFMISVGVALLGYTYGNKGFAYIGIPPFFIDTLIFLLSSLVLVFRPKWLRLVNDPTVSFLLLFMFWGALRTIPFLSTYGVDALRDSVIWFWGVIALAVAYLTRQGYPLHTIATWYGSTMKWYVLWVPVAFIAHVVLGEMLPRWPWGPSGGVPIIVFKGGDTGVLLSGVLAFYLFVAPHITARRRLLPPWVTLPSWFFSMIIAASINRGGFVALLIASTFAAYYAKFRRLATLSLSISLLVLIGFFATSLGDLPKLGNKYRVVSLEQIAFNLKTIFIDIDGFQGTGTKKWRLMWWNRILSYTFTGEYFLFGKGFGVNLADDDGFQVTKDGSLRSPHNGHLTILARMGVPGFFLWSIFVFSLMFRLWLRYKRFKRYNEEFYASICLWLLTFLLAALVNSTFDVYLEGPMGGIWFWSVAGVAVGLITKRPLVYRELSRGVYHKVRFGAENE